MSDPVKPAPMFPIDLESAPKITLAGKQWPIPILAIAQNRVIVPAIMKTLGLMQQIGKVFEKRAKGDPNWFESLTIGTEDIDRLADVTYAALTRAHPGMARAEFDQMPISFAELLEAAPVIMNQTNSFKVAKPGEAEAAGTKETSTSTSSSPTTAPAPEKSGQTS